MSTLDTEDLDYSALNRQQRIADIMQSILPGIDAQRSRKRFVKGVAAALLAVVIFVGGYEIGEQLRPLSYSEKMIVQALIVHTAKEQRKSVDVVTANLVKHMGVEKVKYIKSHQLNDALMVLGQYMD